MQDYQDLNHFLEKEDFKDGDAWLEKLLKHNRLLGALSQIL